MVFGIILIIISYLLGSIPFGLIIGKTAGKDLRENGSGNIGSTNAVRILGWKLGLLSAFCDVIKGIIVILFVYLLEYLNVWHNPFVIADDNLYALYGLAAVIGHCFPIYIKFKGGKAVATSFGVLLAIAPYSALAAIITFVISILISGFVSLSSTFATVAAIMTSYIIYGFIISNNIFTCIIITILGLLIVIKHIPNYKRLLNGTEHNFKKKKT